MIMVPLMLRKGEPPTSLLSIAGAPFPYSVPSSRAASAVMRGNRKRDTKPELAIPSALHRRGLRFRTNHWIRTRGLSALLDLVLVRAGLAVIVDRCFWHRCQKHGTLPQAKRSYWQVNLDRNVVQDRLVDRELEQHGWGFLRFWTHEPIPLSVETVVFALAERRLMRS